MNKSLSSLNLKGQPFTLKMKIAHLNLTIKIVNWCVECYLAGIYLFKSTMRTLKQCVKSVQNKQYASCTGDSIVDFKKVNTGWLITPE